MHQRMLKSNKRRTKKAATVAAEKRQVKKIAAAVDAAATATQEAASVDYCISTGVAGDIKPLFNDTIVVPIDDFKAICIKAPCPNRALHQIQKNVKTVIDHVE